LVEVGGFAPPSRTIFDLLHTTIITRFSDN